MELTPVVTLTGTTLSVSAEGVSSTLLDPTIPVYFNLMIRRPESITAYADAILAGQKSALSYEEFTQRFSTSEEDIALIEAFAQATGLTVLNSHLPSATVKLTATAFQVNMAFGIDLITVITEEDRSYMSYIGTITIPAVLDGIIEYIIGLDNSIKFEPRVTALNYPTDTFLTPLQVAKAYNFPPADGSGVCIGIIALGGVYNTQNITDSFSQANINLPPPTIVNIVLDANGNVLSNGSLINNFNSTLSNREVMLDIFVAACVAPKAKIAMYCSDGTTGFEAINSQIVNVINAALYDSINKPNVLSLSYASFEYVISSSTMASYNATLAQSTVLGIPICIAAGNRGAEFPTSVTNETIGFPDCSPYVLACGGTSLTLNPNGTIKSEVVWNNPNLLPLGENRLSAAGGSGISSLNRVPSYQAGLTYTPCTVLADGTGQTNGLTITLIDGSLNTVLPYQGRVYPDVAGNADQSTGYQFYYDACGNGYNSSLVQAGGTSSCAPLYAGLFARCFQLSGNTALMGPSGNFINTLLYNNRVFAFNDISGGNNARRGNTGGYACTAGWDAATGLGSPKGMKILSLLNGTKETAFATNVSAYQPTIGTSGTVIDIFGDGFTNGDGKLGSSTVVTLNNTTCVRTIISTTQLQCIVPSSILSSGTYDLVVTNPNLLPSTFAMPFVYYRNNVYTFTPTSGTYQYPNIPIPQGATRVQITAVGGGGGGATLYGGGSGAKVINSYLLTGNGITSLNVNIGGGGKNRINRGGGGGGGLTQVISNNNGTAINIVAGGGGGASSDFSGNNAGLPNGLTSYDGNFNQAGSGGQVVSNGNGAGGNFNSVTTLSTVSGTVGGGGSGSYLINGGTNANDNLLGGLGGVGGGGTGASVLEGDNGGGGGGGGYGGGSGGSNSLLIKSGGGGSIALRNGTADTSANYTSAANGGLPATSGSDGFVILQFITSPAPTIGYINLTTGGSTSTVTITGTNFLTSPLPTVSLVGVTGTATADVTKPCTVNSATATDIQVQVPFMFINGSYNFRVTNNDGQISNLSSAFNYNVNPVPTITSITPSSGTAGSAIDIVGTNFVQGAIVTLNSYTFNGHDFSSFSSPCAATVDSSSNIRISFLPSLTDNNNFPNTNTITVTNPGTTSSISVNNFTYTTPQPTIIRVRDFTSGNANTSITSGQSIILDISNLLINNFDITMNSNSITSSATLQSSGIVTVQITVPMLGVSDGSYNITVTNNKGSSYNQVSLSSSYQIQYVEGAPTISNIISTSTITNGGGKIVITSGNMINIYGLNFNNPTVTMNGRICTSLNTGNPSPSSINYVDIPFITEGVVTDGITPIFTLVNSGNGKSVTYSDNNLTYVNPYPFFTVAVNRRTNVIVRGSSNGRTGYITNSTNLSGTLNDIFDISGKRFINNLTFPTTIKLNNINCIVTYSQTIINEIFSLTIQVPFIAASTGTYNLVMANPGNGGSIAILGPSIYPFQYTAPASVISNINSGAAVSTGSTVTVTGSNFYGTPIIQIGTIQYTNVSVSVATGGNSLTFIAPFLSDGLTTSYNLTVIQDGISSNPFGFTYTIPTISNITFTPSFGVNGSTITVSGTNICSNATFTINNSGNASIVANTYSSSSNGSQTSNRILAPANPSGSYKINVFNPGKSAVSSTLDFIYTNPPTVTACSPSFGTDSTSVTITGTNFLAGATVTIGNGNATSVNVSSTTTLTCIVPSSGVNPNTKNGYFIRVTNPSQYIGQNPLLSGISATPLFGYINPITANVAVSPLTIANNTPITVTGTNFLDGATVTFNNSAAITAYNVSLTKLTFNVPLTHSFSSGYTSYNYSIVITNGAEVVGGVTQTTGIPSTIITPSFSYNPPPTMLGISPSSGEAGTIVDISGAGFLPNPSVVINDVAYPATRLSATQIRFFMPALGSNGTYLLTVQNTDIQKSATRAPFVFTVPFRLPFVGAIVIPPNFIGSMFTNNSNYYKPGSHSAGANGVRNSRAIRRRT